MDSYKFLYGFKHRIILINNRNMEETCSCTLTFSEALELKYFY